MIIRYKPLPNHLSFVWYRTAGRRVLENLDSGLVESADAEANRLETLESSFSQEVPVCFLGASGIGKSIGSSRFVISTIWRLVHATVRLLRPIPSYPCSTVSRRVTHTEGSESSLLGAAKRSESILVT